MKVRIDGDKCQGHQVCFGLCPSIFLLDDDGYTTTREDEPVP